MGTGLASFIAGMGTGYFSAKDKQAERDRQARMDKIVTDRADREARDDQEAQNIKQELGAAATQPKVADTAAVPADGVGPVAPEDSPERYQVGNASFGTAPEASAAAAAGAKSPDQVNAAMAGVFRKYGQVDKAMSLEASTKQAKVADLQLKDAESAAKHKEFAQAAFQSLQQGGTQGFAKFATEAYGDGRTYNVQDDGKGGGTVTVADKDGKPVGSAIPFKSPEDLVMMAISRADPSKWVDYKGKQNTEARQQENWEKEYTLRKKDSESNADYRKRSLGIAQAAESRAAATFKKQMEDEKLPPEVKMQLSSLYDSKKVMFGAIQKAMSEDNYKADSDNAVKQAEQMKAIDSQIAVLNEKWSTKTPKGKPGIDYLGGPAPAATPVAQPSQMPVPQNTPAQSNAPAAPAPVKSDAPVRSTDGGKTYTLDVPQEIRDPSVPFYRLIPNPAYAAIKGQTFKSRQEAEAAFQQVNTQP